MGKDTCDLQGCEGAFDKVNRELECLKKLEGKIPVSESSALNVKLLDIRVQSLVNWDSSKVSPTRCLGIAADAFGNSIQYVADWGETNCSAGTKFTLHVSWSWGDPSCTVKNNLSRFDHIWNSENGLLSYEADVILSKKLPGILNYLLSSPYVESAQPKEKELFPHQKAAVDNWMKKDCRGIFQMCTGAGKTIASLAAVRGLADKLIANGEQIPPVIVTVPTRILADQWVEEIRGFGYPVILQAYNAFNQWNDLLEPFLTVGYDGHPRFVVTTYCSFSDPRFTKCLTRAADDGHTAVWIADEMHNLSTKALRQTMSEDSAFFKYRLGLSATPDIENDFSASDFLIRYFGDVCQVYDLRDGITDKVLCRYRYYPVPAFLSPELGAPYLSLLAQIHDKKVDSARLINLYRESRQLLRRSGVQLSRFADLLSQLQVAGKQMEHTLVYCPPGYGSYGSEKSDEIDKDEDELRLVEGVVGILRGKGHSTASILGETVSAQRREILTRFRSGELQTLCAIGCLDEGVDVPSIKRAIVLYSVDRNKQFVQRRGRILRNPTRDDQKIAEIYDIILLPQGTDMPPEQAEVLIEREFRRYRTFADLAMNREEAQSILTEALNRITSVNSNMEVINGD
jgi:superfamily II DNA or RNA helicase